jgi:hypothetical protein
LNDHSSLYSVTYAMMWQCGPHLADAGGHYTCRLSQFGHLVGWFFNFLRVIFAKPTNRCLHAPEFLASLPPPTPPSSAGMPRLDYAGAVLRASPRSMASGSSASSVGRHRGPFIPTIPCPDSCRLSTHGVSSTATHEGWVYYKCRNHGVCCLSLCVLLLDCSVCCVLQFSSLCCVGFSWNFNLHFVLPMTAWMQFLALGTRVRGVSG